MADILCCHICKTTHIAVAKAKELEKVLPPGYSHILCEVGEEERVRLKVRLSKVKDVEKWVSSFENSSAITWRKARTYPESGKYNTYKVDYRCQHKTYSSGPKDSDCPAAMTVVLKRSPENRRSRSTDLHIGEGYLLQVKWNNNHNHLLDSEEVLRRRDVSGATVERLTQLFQQGHSPSSALETIKSDLQEEKGGDYFRVAADRSVVPDPGFCYKLYYKIFAKAYGASGDGCEDLQARIEELNQEQGVCCAQMEEVEGRLLVAVCTPVMQRVHAHVQQSAEVMFVDSSGTCDGENHRMFWFMTQSAAGRIPLAVLITPCEDPPTLTAGLRLLKGLLPPDAFFNRGAAGPQTILTEDCPALRLALHATYPSSRLLLCTFLLLQAAWRWLWDGHNAVNKQDRPPLLTAFRRLVCVREEERSAAYAQLHSGFLAKRYANFLNHVATVYGRREDWAPPHQSPDHYVERAMKVMKDKVVRRPKPYSLAQLVDFMVTRFEPYYTSCLTDFANNRVVVRRQQARWFTSDVVCQRITREDDTNFSVPRGPGTATWYHVNTSLGVCTCAVGLTGANCKHQNAVVRTFGVNEATASTCSPQLRSTFLHIATGKPPSRQDADEADEADEATRSSAGTSSSDTEGLKRKLQEFVDGLKRKLDEDESYCAPVQAFLSSFSKLHSDADVQAALRSVGGEAPPAQPKRQKRPRVFLQTPTTIIAVQPDGARRRKTAPGGRRSLGAGPPPHSSREEHGYHKNTPLNLSVPVQNTASGKTH